MKKLIILTLLSSGFFYAWAECRKDTIYYYSFSLYDIEKYNDARTINSFDANNNLIENLGQTWNSTSLNWENSSKKNYGYDANNRPINQIDCKWTSNNWVNQKKITRNYDANGNKIDELNQNWNLTLLSWENVLKTEWTYTNNKLMQEVAFEWNKTNNAWLAILKLSYTYDNNGNNTILLREGWIKTKNKWGSSSKYSNSYSDNNLMVKLYQLADSFGNFYDRQKFVFTYDNSNNVQDQTSYFGTGTLAISGKYLYQYDGQNNRTQQVFQRYLIASSKFENSEKLIYLFNSRNVKIAEYFQKWDEAKAAWLLNSRDSFEYNLDNDLASIDHQYNYSYAYNTYASHTREEYICTFIEGSVAIKPILTLNHFKIYPNPANANFITIETSKNGDYSLTELNGRILKKGFLLKGENKIELPISITNGIYFIKVDDNFQKIIINK